MSEQWDCDSPYKVLTLLFPSWRSSMSTKLFSCPEILPPAHYVPGRGGACLCTTWIPPWILLLDAGALVCMHAWVDGHPSTPLPSFPSIFCLMSLAWSPPAPLYFSLEWIGAGDAGNPAYSSQTEAAWGIGATHHVHHVRSKLSFPSY